MPLQATSGAASYDGFGGGAAAVPTYIEDVFSTYLYTGSSTTPQTITNGINLSGKGGLVWVKKRSAAGNNVLFDTARGGLSALYSNQTAAAEVGPLYGIDTSFNADGFTFNTGNFHDSGSTYASWTFRKQPKFFDVVTYTGTGSAMTVPHSLGAVPACIIVKRTDTTGAWCVYHQDIGSSNYLFLNSTAAQATNSQFWNSTDPTSTVFSVGTNGSVNAVGGTYVAYIFASNAGGFGLTGTDNVISCGSYVGNGSATGPVVNLGYEPQWVMIKSVGSIGGWVMLDTMRGMTSTASNGMVLQAQSTGAEGNWAYVQPTATGFQIANSDTYLNSSGFSYIYIAIRRGPMKVPTDATKVFSPALYTGTGSNNTITSSFPSDLLLVPNRAGQFYSPSFWDRLRGATNFLRSPGTDAEATSTDGLTSFSAGQNSVAVGADATYGNINFSGRNYVPYFFRRAPSFFDEVCYTGTGSATTFNHNLGVAPELIIFKNRTGTNSWTVYAAPLGATKALILETTNASAATSNFNNTAPTSSVFSVGGFFGTNGSGQNYVAYLFATCAGVSKVGSYTGNGSTQTIDCGFTGGARFVLIKRTDSTGDWYVYDTARGMTTLTDPYLLLNSTAAETATLGSVTTVSTGFAVDASILAAVNTNAASYIFLAIA